MRGFEEDTCHVPAGVHDWGELKLACSKAIRHELVVDVILDGENTLKDVTDGRPRVGDLCIGHLKGWLAPLG